MVRADNVCCDNSGNKLERVMFKIVRLPLLILFTIGALMFSGCYIANGKGICAILALVGILVSAVLLLFVDK